MKQKQVFKNAFIVGVIIIMLMPTLVTFNSMLTGLLNHLHWYVWLQDHVVPFESRLVAVILKAMGITTVLTPGNHDVSLLLKKSNEYIPVALEWNCLGWQSMLLLVVTFINGFRGNFTGPSIIQAILFGIIGTFLINLFRMALIISTGFYLNKLALFIIHDYFAVFVGLIWIIFFWWFSYAYLLEEKEVLEEKLY